MGQPNVPEALGMSPVFIVSELERSIAYHTAQLGFAEEFRYGDTYAGLHLDGFPLHLKQGTVTVAERRSRPIPLPPV